MDCNKIEAWLDDNNLSNQQELPKELENHMNVCAECHEKYNLVRSFRSAAASLKPSENTKKRAWNGIKQSLPATSKTNTEASLSWIDRLNQVFENFGMKHAMAMAMVAFAAFGLFLLRNSEPIVHRKVPVERIIVGSLTGTGAVIRRGLEESRISQNPIQFEKDNIVTSDSHDSTIMLALADGSKVELQGQCQIQIGEDGFKIKSGNFSGDFSLKSGSTQRVEVPGAVLNIVGTKINFLVNGQNGRLDLIEGSVNVETPAKLATFAWHAGTRITIKDGAVETFPTEIPAETNNSNSSSSSTNFADPQAPEATSSPMQSGSQGTITDIENIIKD